MKNLTPKTIGRSFFSLTIQIGFLLALSATSKAAPPTPISTCTTINASGHYELVAHLTNFGTCIIITANHVHLKLNGHTITGPFNFADLFSGIQAVGVSHVDIQGPGTITNFGRGLDFAGVDFSDVKGVTATGNFFGFVVNRDFANNPNNLSEKNLFREDTATGNTAHGFTLNGASNNHFLNNTASNNGANGILLFDGTSNQVKDNTTDGNGGDGISAGGGVSTGHLIKDNTASGNAGSGMLRLDRWETLFLSP